MALSDAKFLTTEPVAEEPRPNFKQALAGVGDKFRRDAGDYFLGFTGTPLAEGQTEPWAVGDIVEYETPDGVRRCGQLLRPSCRLRHTNTKETRPTIRVMFLHSKQ